MQLRVEVQDADPGHLVEAGIDRFRITNATSLDNQEEVMQISVYPNPVSNGYVNAFLHHDVQTATAQLYDLTGTAISMQNGLKLGANQIIVPETAGIYLLETVVDGKRSIHRLLVH
jgi:hypothetical protein